MWDFYQIRCYPFEGFWQWYVLMLHYSVSQLNIDLYPSLLHHPRKKTSKCGFRHEKEKKKNHNSQRSFSSFRDDLQWKRQNVWNVASSIFIGFASKEGDHDATEWSTRRRSGIKDQQIVVEDKLKECAPNRVVCKEIRKPVKEEHQQQGWRWFESDFGIRLRSTPFRIDKISSLWGGVPLLLLLFISIRTLLHSTVAKRFKRFTDSNQFRSQSPSFFYSEAPVIIIIIIGK